MKGLVTDEDRYSFPLDSARKRSPFEASSNWKKPLFSKWRESIGSVGLHRCYWSLCSLSNALLRVLRTSAEYLANVLETSISPKFQETPEVAGVLVGAKD